MAMESYRNNIKTTTEGKTVPLRLPLNIESGTKFSEGGEAEVWEIYTGYGKSSDQDHLVLKISRDEAFTTKEEMQKAERFYEFLKSFPGLGKFIPDTIYFKAQETDEDTPKAFCIQQFKKGERIDRLKDDVIYKDPEVVRQLLELVDVSIEVMRTVRKSDGQYPDFMRTPEFNSDKRVKTGASVFKPRYSSNILVTDQPDKNGQRVWFVDVGVNANARRQKGWEWEKRHAVGFAIETQFKAWKRQLKRILSKLSPK